MTPPRFISADPKPIRDAFDNKDFLFELPAHGQRQSRGREEWRLLNDPITLPSCRMDW